MLRISSQNEEEKICLRKFIPKSKIIAITESVLAIRVSLQKKESRSFLNIVW